MTAGSGGPPDTPVAAQQDPAVRGVIILLRHARSTANNEGILAGRSAGVDLDASGRQQATALAARFAGARIARIVTSPMLRCRRTVAPLAQQLGVPVTTDDDLSEVDYGAWAGRSIKELSGEPLWRTVQAQPSAVVFPGGESLAAVSARAVAAARRYAAAAGDGATVLCSHGDVIKAILADALGMHLDQFQRIAISPASLSVIHYTAFRTFVERMGETGSLEGVGLPPAPPAPAGAVAGRDAAAPAPGDETGAIVGGDPGRRIR